MCLVARDLVGSVRCRQLSQAEAGAGASARGQQLQATPFIISGTRALQVDSGEERTAALCPLASCMAWVRASSEG